MASAINLVVLDVSSVNHRDRGHVTLAGCPAMMKRLTGEKNKKKERPDFHPAFPTHSTMRTALKSSFDAAPQICAYQPHTVWLLRICIFYTATMLSECRFLASHQYWGHRWA